MTVPSGQVCVAGAAGGFRYETEIGRMVDFVNEHEGDPEIIDAARQIVLGCKPRDQQEEADTIYGWVCNHTRFVQDPYNKEALSTPIKMLDDIYAHGKASGDCDDLSTFLATMLGAVGIEPRFRFGGNKDQGIHHVWVQARQSQEFSMSGRDRWVDYDPSIKSKPGKHHKFELYEIQGIFE